MGEDRSAEAGGRPPALLAEKLDFLFEHKRPPVSGQRRSRYTNRELAEYVRERTGRCTEAYISKLRNPHEKLRISFEKLQAIAKFFGVRVDVFADDYEWSADDIRDQLELLAALDRTDARIEAARAILSMDPDEVSAVRPELTRLLNMISERSRAKPANERTRPMMPRFQSAAEADLTREHDDDGGGTR
jgi:transcriptional regulator with XRE-family HTH domain